MIFCNTKSNGSRFLHLIASRTQARITDKTMFSVIRIAILALCKLLLLVPFGLLPVEAPLGKTDDCRMRSKIFSCLLSTIS